MKTFKLLGFFVLLDRSIQIMGIICYMCSDIHAGNATWSCADPFKANSPTVIIKECPRNVKQCTKSIFRYNDDVFFTRMCAIKDEQVDGCKEINKKEHKKIQHTECSCSMTLCNSASSFLYRREVYSLGTLYVILVAYFRKIFICIYQ